MQDILDEIISYLKGIWIKRRYIILSTWLICPIGWYLVAAMPNTYKSHARVYVDTQSLLRPLLRGLTVETNPNTQIRLMLRTLLSRPNLERISRMTDLDVQSTDSASYEKIINNLKRTIRVSSGGRENIYTISNQNKDPDMAKNIVQSVLTVFIENTLGESRNDSDNAQKFLTAQINEYENRLIEDEARLTSFKQKYSGVLPNQTGGYYNKLNTSKVRLKAIELELLEAKTKLKSAKKQISQSVAKGSADENILNSGNSIQTTFDSRITDLEIQLDRLKLRYTDRHPEVVEITRNINQLSKQRSEEIKTYLAQNTEGVTRINSQSNNPVIQEIQIQVNQLETLVSSLNVRANNHRNSVKSLENKIHTLPEIEAELVALNRGYKITKKKFEALLSRRETARLAQQADETTDKIQFKVIDAPRKGRLSGPPRVTYFALVTFAGVAVGVGISLLMSLLNPIATSTFQISKATGVPVFGVISANENLGLQKWNRRKTFIFIGSNLLLLCVLMIFVSYPLLTDAIITPLKRIF